MKKIYLLNFSLMEKIADKKNGITTEDATSFVTCVEIFYLLLMAEFTIMRILPFKVKDYVMYTILVLIGLYTHFVLRKVLKKIIVDLGIRKTYKSLDKSQQKRNLALSVLIFFGMFFIFFIVCVWAIGGYYKKH